MVANHTLIESSLQHGLIDVLERLPVPRWVTQETSVPIAVILNDLVFLRAPGLSNNECIGLADLTVGILCETASGKRDGQDIAGSATTELKKPRLDETHASAGAAATNSDAPASPFPSAGGRFPLTYTWDMVVGMKKIYDVKAEIDLPVVFTAAFPGLSYTRSTVRRHCTMFRRAKELGILDPYIAHGRTAAGKWSLLVQCKCIFAPSHYLKLTLDSLANIDVTSPGTVDVTSPNTEDVTLPSTDRTDCTVERASTAPSSPSTTAATNDAAEPLHIESTLINACVRQEEFKVDEHGTMASFWGNGDLNLILTYVKPPYAWGRHKTVTTVGFFIMVAQCNQLTHVMQANLVIDGSHKTLVIK